MTNKEIAEYIQDAILKSEKAGQEFADRQEDYSDKYPYAFGYLSASLNKLIDILKH